MEKRLYRSRTNFMLAGVCGGLGEYISIDPTIVRIFFIIITLADGIGILIYLLLWFIIPRADEINANSSGTYSTRDEISNKAQQMGDDFRQAVRHYNKDTTKFIGIAFIATGCLFFLKEFLNIWIPQINSSVIWSLCLILGGSVLLWRTLRKQDGK